MAQVRLLCIDSLCCTLHTANANPFRQKATKTLAASNTKRLNQTLYTSLAVHGIWWLLRALLFRSSFSRKSLVLYLLLSAPQLLIQLYLERLSRPTFTADGAVKKPGEDLDAKGLTEYMWDVVYWTYACIVMAALLGDYAWFLWAIIPAYSVYAAWGVYAGMRGGYQDAAGVPQPQAASKRQAKMEKRVGKRCSIAEDGPQVMHRHVGV